MQSIEVSTLYATNRTEEMLILTNINIYQVHSKTS